MLKTFLPIVAGGQMAHRTVCSRAPKAKELAKEVGTDAVALTARRLTWYTNLDGWATFGRGWARRCADLLKVVAELEAAK